MRYIKKSEKPPLNFEQWKQSKKGEIDEKCHAYNMSKKKEDKKEHLSSEIVWKILPTSPSKENNDFSKDELRILLLEEQGYLCAYCGTRLANDPLRVKLDHVTPKSIEIKGTFDYYNIVAVCSGGTECIFHTISKGETLESIAEYYKTDVESIVRLNKDLTPHLLEVGTLISLRIVVVVRNEHCDAKKGHQKGHIDPTVDTKCQSKFHYQNGEDIIGKIHAVKEYKEEADKTIKMLGLNDNPLLIDKRKRILFKIDNFVRSIMKINKTLLRENLLKKKDKLYQNPQDLPEMVFVEEFFINFYLSK